MSELEKYKKALEQIGSYSFGIPKGSYLWKVLNEAINNMRTIANEALENGRPSTVEVSYTKESDIRFDYDK